MAAEFVHKVVFEHDGVFIHPSDDSDSVEPYLLVSGSLRIMDKDGDITVEYRPLEDTVDMSNMLCAGKDSSSVVQWTQCSGEETQQSCETEWDMVNTVSFRRKPCEFSLLPCSPAGGATPFPNHSQERSRWTFSFSLRDLRSLTVSTKGSTFIVFTLKESSTPLPALHFHQGGSREFLDSLRRYALLTESPDNHQCLMVSTPNKALSQSFENLLDDNNFGLIQKLRKDPYVATLGSFSKVTNYIFEAFRGSEEQHQRPPEEVADLLGEVIPGLEINQQEEPGFEVITRIDLGARPQVTRLGPVSTETWAKHQDVEGRLFGVKDLKCHIFRGGLCHSVRKEAWKFLLEYFPWNSSLEDRKCLQKDRTDEYFRMKLQWKSVSAEQEKRNSRLRDYRSLIEKDVNRTDRNNRFYEGIDNPGLALLHDILMTYCMYDFDLGYVQGMSDLLSPILFVMENEVDAFWCFVSFMDQMHQNFEEQMQGMKTQLVQLSSLLRLLDLTFWNYLESQDSGFLYFCFRWLLIRFKRELSFQDVLRLWEVMWTGLPCENFHLLICCSILDSEKHKIMEENMGFNEILKHVNELSMKLDVEEILQRAEGICMQLSSCKDLPDSVRNILGFSSHKPVSKNQNQLQTKTAPHSGVLTVPPAAVAPTYTAAVTPVTPPPIRTSQRHDVCTNGHLRDQSSYSVAFMS
ncbi:TBC1 domain family member 15 [Cynoglossus semilaevis]|uniref:TBC1 domain family member 15 n=1 Tax=Cynoglossus semilaevis TaxID=244447 RepID=UPI0004983052|nr:TBC1 domain family member 15 [Cynoglossus semilaevis]